MSRAKRIFLWVTLSLIVLIVLTSVAISQEHSRRSVEMRNKADELLWIGDSVVIAVDFDGFVNKTAKLQAFRAADLTELWYTEVPVGKRQRFEGALWFDKQAGVMFLGHGPFSAVDLRDGTVLWSIPYDTIGFVHDVLFGTERLLVLGSERISSFRLQWSLSP
ncbi:MAG: PQQ-like beta-propeller repeat protein, partial [candidate division Zixibacteria bacterium]|nr:PQQ-like beta-propeller repeat protein [candidate division Zixibacteria bacterium]